MRAPYFYEQVIHHVVVGDNRVGQGQILTHKGVDTLRYHFDGSAGHVADVVAFPAGPAAQKTDNLGNIVGLIADTLHVGDHFKRGGNLPEIPRYRLLLQKKLEAHGLYISLF